MSTRAIGHRWRTRKDWLVDAIRWERLTNALTKEKNRIADDRFRHPIAIFGEYVDAFGIAQTYSPAEISRNCRSVQIARADGDVAGCSGRIEFWIKRIHSIDAIVMQHKEAAQGR